MSIQREAWLGQKVEEAIDPGLPICDPHHHFWDREGDRYLLDQLTQDLGGGHNVAQTVFIECHSMYRAKGPEGNAGGRRNRICLRASPPRAPAVSMGPLRSPPASLPTPT